MASTSRRTNRSLSELLIGEGNFADEAYKFDFFQAVYLLSRLYPEFRAIGRDAPPWQEPVRFHAHASMNFPASQIHKIAQQGGVAHMTVAFLGLTGPEGMLPAHYNELLMAQTSNKDEVLRAFLDIFNHRLIAFFYRAWEKHHFVVGYEREQSGERGADRFTSHLFALIGMGTSGLRKRLALNDLGLLQYAGLIAQQPHSAVGLRAILSDFFRIAVEIEQFRGRWMALERDSLSYLDAPGLHNQLGVGAIAGDAVWDIQSQFRLRIGPVDRHQFLEFLPDRQAFRKLTQLCGFYVGIGLAFDVQVILRAKQVPECCLSDEAADAPRLGWSSWLRTDEFEHDACDAVFETAAAYDTAGNLY